MRLYVYTIFCFSCFILSLVTTVKRNVENVAFYKFPRQCIVPIQCSIQKLLHMTQGTLSNTGNTKVLARNAKYEIIFKHIYKLKHTTLYNQFLNNFFIFNLKYKNRIIITSTKCWYIRTPSRFVHRLYYNAKQLLIYYCAQ